MLGFAILFHLPKATRDQGREGRAGSGPGPSGGGGAPPARRGSARPGPRPQPLPHNGAGPALRHFVGASSPGWAAGAAGRAGLPGLPPPSPPPALPDHSQASSRPTGVSPRPLSPGAPCLPGAGRAPPTDRPGRPLRDTGPGPTQEPAPRPRPRRAMSEQQLPSRHFVFPSASMDGRGAPGPEAAPPPAQAALAATSPL